MITFTKHTGNTQPIEVLDADYVAYKTHSDKGLLTHMPVKAEQLTWDYSPKIGRIAEYAVVNKPHFKNTYR